MIVFSIPYRSSEFVRNQINPEKGIWIEYRLDYLKSLSDFSEQLINKKTVVTIRDISQGGINYFGIQQKIQFYKQIIKKYNCLVDLEIENYSKEIDSENLILSHHNFIKFNLNQLKEVVMGSNKLPSKYLKIAVIIDKYSDLLKIPELIKLSTKPVIFLGMGKLGRISRLLHKPLKSIGVYISNNENPTATGQIFFHEIDKFNLTKLNDQTMIGGIIGGDQVEKSIGLNFYNRYFNDNSINAVYFPFVANDFDDFWYWLTKSKIDFFGFSITMPYKRILASKLNINVERNLNVVNTYLPKSNKVFNTDIIAFQKSKEYLKLIKKDKLLILGNGGSAQAALEAFKNFKSVFISSRNKKEGERLTLKYSCSYQKAENLAVFTNFVLINCTPIGMNDENVLKELNLRLPRKIIDLPYTNKKTYLVVEAEKNKIPFVSGKMFWEWQSEKQLNLFLKEIVDQSK